MFSYRLIACVALACGLLAQVPTEPYAVAGVVQDARTGLPIAGVDVRVSGGGPTSTTDERGEFSVRVPAQKSRPTLSTSKRGYSGGVVRDLSPGMRNLRITMTPNRQLTGQVVDAETREPVAGLTVVGSPGSVRYVGRISGQSVGARTDADGRFSMSISPSASDVFVIVSPPLWTPQSWVQKNPTEADRTEVERDYELFVWPGASSPLKLQAGNDVDAGVFPLRKVDYYRANILFSEDTCEKRCALRCVGL